MSRYFDKINEYRVTKYQAYENTANAIAPLSVPGGIAHPDAAPVEFEGIRKRPARPMNLESDAGVPLAHYLITGSTAFFISLYFWGFWGTPWHVAIIAFFLSGIVAYYAGVWLSLLNSRMKESITIIPVEEEAEAPPPIELSVNVYDAKDRFKKQLRLELGVEPEDLLTFCRAALRGSSLAVSAWTGKGNLFTRSEYDNLIGELERTGCVNPGSGNTPRALTDVGRQALAQMVTELQQHEQKW